MEIKNLTYKQIALIRKAVIEKRERIWEDKVFPFKKTLQKMSFDEVTKIKEKFNKITNQFLEEGVCNLILNNLEKIEEDIQKEFNLVQGCNKVLFGNKAYGEIKCGDRLGHWVNDIWMINKEPVLCKECKKKEFKNGTKIQRSI